MIIIFIFEGSSASPTFTRGWKNEGPYDADSTRNDTTASLESIYVSSSSSGTAGSISFQDEDILAYDPKSDTWSMVFDGSDVGVEEDLSGFLLLTDGNIRVNFVGRFQLTRVIIKAYTASDK